MTSGRSVASAIEIFVRVAELGSFRRAAAALRLTPSAVSKSVSRLEEKLGVALLARSTRQVHLTPEGEVLLDHGRRALAEIDTAQARLSHRREGVEGTVHLEAWPFLAQTFVAPALPAFLRRHPGLVVQLALRDQPRAPGDHDVDIALGIAPPATEDLVVRKAGTLVGRVLLCASPAYLSVAGRPRTLDELRLHACLGFVVREQVQPWLLATPEGPVSIVPRGPLTSTSKEVLIETAVGGLGIVRVADVMVSALLKARALETVLDEHAVTERQPVFVARRSGRWLPQRTRVVFQFLLDLFASRDDR